MFRLNERRSELLNPFHVEEARKAEDMPGERKLKASRLTAIRSWIANKRFCRAHFAYAECAEDGKTYRVNGQHTSTVLSECNDDDPKAFDFPKDIQVDLEFWKCDTKSELSDIFDTFDNPKSARTNDDKLGVYQAQYSDLQGVSRKVCKAGLQAINELRRQKNEDGKPAVALRETGLLLAETEVREFIRWLMSFDNAPNRLWANQGIGAAMAESFYEDRDSSDAIWSQVIDEANPDPRDPKRLWASQIRATVARSTRNKGWYFRNARKEYRKWKKEIGLAV